MVGFIIVMVNILDFLFWSHGQHWMLKIYTTCIKQGVVSMVIGEESLAYPTQPILLAMYKYVMCSPRPCHIKYHVVCFSG